MKKTKRFSFNFSPLRLSTAVTVIGSVPTRQTYDADTGEYTPDYTLAPLVIQPRVGVVDRDGIIPSGEVNASLANVSWQVAEGGTYTEIADASAVYEVTRTGADAGRLKVKRNATPGVPLSLRFTAQYVDSRTGQIHHIDRTLSIRCTNATSAIPRLVLDAAPQTIYNPLEDEARQSVRATLLLGTKECPAADREFVWEKWRDYGNGAGAWTEVGSDPTLDYDTGVSSDGMYCTVDRSLMGERLDLRCRAKYDPDGSPSAVALDDSSPSATVAFVRRIPRYEYDIEGTPANIPPGLSHIYPEAAIRGTKGIIDDPERELLPLWSAAENKASGALDYKLMAHGLAPAVPTTAFHPERGAIIALEVKDRGPWGAWADTDGAVFTDESGNALIIK